MSSARMLNLAPRCTAASPAANPAAPSKVATHRAVVATAADTCTDCTTHGGPMVGMTTGGDIHSLRPPDAPSMIRNEPPLHPTGSPGRTPLPAAPGPPPAPAGAGP